LIDIIRQDYQRRFKKLEDELLDHENRIKKIEGQRVQELLNDISKRMISDRVREILTPIQLNQNMEMKDLRQAINDINNFIENKIVMIEEAYENFEDLKNATLFQMKNKNKEIENYKREIARMQRLDRIRLQGIA
jgi:alanyl-tRNA synthetase